MKETADKAKETADKVQEKVDLIQSLEQQDWINGTKTEHALISPVHLLASIQAHSSNSSGGGSCSCNGALKPIEILMTESGEIPWPEGTTDETELEIWAWGGGDAGSDKLKGGDGGEGGYGGCCTYVRTRKKFLGKNSVSIGKGGKTPSDPGGKATTVGRFIIAFSGKDSGKPYQKGVFNGEDATGEDGNYRGKDGVLGGNGGRGALGKGGYGGHGGDNFLSGGGYGGWGGGNNNGKGGDGGGGGGGGSYSNGQVGDGGHSMWGGHGGKGALVSKESNALYGGGGGGYFPGKDATSSSSGDGGDGAVLIKVYL
ncbi:hypothetical protein [Bartonella rochalimae]|uniref:hypothetical protein n=1 Tax=Bartonella rochalimae TaxID=395923 RepID=UPI003F685874